MHSPMLCSLLLLGLALLWPLVLAAKDYVLTPDQRCLEESVVMTAVKDCEKENPRMLKLENKTAVNEFEVRKVLEWGHQLPFCIVKRLSKPDYCREQRYVIFRHFVCGDKENFAAQFCEPEDYITEEELKVMAGEVVDRPSELVKDMVYCMDSAVSYFCEKKGMGFPSSWKKLQIAERRLQEMTQLAKLFMLKIACAPKTLDRCLGLTAVLNDNVKETYREVMRTTCTEANNATKEGTLKAEPDAVKDLCTVTDPEPLPKGLRQDTSSDKGSRGASAVKASIFLYLILTVGLLP